MAALYAKLLSDAPGFPVLVNGNRILPAYFLAVAAKRTFSEIADNVSIVSFVMSMMKIMIFHFIYSSSRLNPDEKQMSRYLDIFFDSPYSGPRRLSIAKRKHVRY
jgi:hypothetical protein